jgi:hypothetical protein
LTSAQEEFLVEWILEEDAHGFPPSHACAQEKASWILRMNGDDAPLGKVWIPHFLQRNPRVASIISRKIKAARVTNTLLEQIQAFLELFRYTKERLNIRDEDI